MEKGELISRVRATLPDGELEDKVVLAIEDFYDAMEVLAKYGWAFEGHWSFANPRVLEVAPHTMPETTLPGEGVAHALFEEGLAGMFASVGAKGLHGGMFPSDMRGDRKAPPMAMAEEGAAQPTLPGGEAKHGGAAPVAQKPSTPSMPITKNPTSERSKR